MNQEMTKSKNSEKTLFVRPYRSIEGLSYDFFSETIFVFGNSFFSMIAWQINGLIDKQIEKETQFFFPSIFPSIFLRKNMKNSIIIYFV